MSRGSFQKKFSWGKFYFFWDLSEYFVDFGKKPSSTIFKNWYFPTFSSNLSGNASELTKSFSMWSKRRHTCRTKVLENVFFLKICFHKKNPISRKRMFPTSGKNVRQRCPKYLLPIQRNFSREKLFWESLISYTFSNIKQTTYRFREKIVGRVFKVHFYVTTWLLWWKLSYPKQTFV